MSIPSLNKLAEMFAKNYAVVSLKFVKSQLQHPDHPHANANAKALLEKAGFVRGRQISLKEPANPSGVTNCVCYWRKDYFAGHAPAYEVMQELANKEVNATTSKEEPATVADQPKEEPLTSGFGAEQTREVIQDLFEKTIKNYLRSLPADHQKAFCYLFEAVNQDLQGFCTLTDADGTIHNFAAGALPEDVRRFYNPLVNMFYQDKDFWGPYIIWLEQHGKSDSYDLWKKLLKRPYSQSLLSGYFFLTDLQALYVEKAEALGC